MQQATLGQQDSLLITIISNLNAQSNQEAIKLIDQTLLNDPTLVALHYPRALALGRLGRVDDAVRSLEILTALEPKAATVKALQGEFNSAKNSSSNKSTDNARASRERDVNSLLDQALEKLNKADPATALNLLIEAKALKVAVRDLDYVRAMCFIELGRVAEARESLREELRHFPDNSIAQELLAQVLEQDQSGKQQETQLVELSNPEFQDLLKTIRPYTMVPTVRLYSLYHLAQQVCQLGIVGNFVECGVAGGGSSALLASIIKKYSKQPRTLFAFDSFEGMPDPTVHDTHNGQAANATGWGSGTCAAPEESVRQISRTLGVGEIVKPIKGLFQDSIPLNRSQLGELAFLHVDGDWYESTKTVLESLYDKVVPGGIIQIDDYGHWDGCKRAVHEFFEKRGMPNQKLNDIDGSGVWFQKS